MSAIFTPQKSGPAVFPVEEHDQITQTWCALHLLVEELSAVQKRLGTPLEQDGDYKLVQDLGHEIRNKLQMTQFWTELGMIEQAEASRAPKAG